MFTVLDSSTTGTTPGGPICDVTSSNYVGSVGTGDPSSLYPYIIDDDNGPPGRDNGNGLFFRNRSDQDRPDHRRHQPDLRRGRAEPEPLSCHLDRRGHQRRRPPGGCSRAEPASILRAAGRSSSRTPAKNHGPNAPSGLAHSDQYWSMHPGGANFLFADGSVRFIKEQVGFTIFQALATRQGNEILSADAF